MISFYCTGLKTRLQKAVYESVLFSYIEKKEKEKIRGKALPFICALHS